MNDFQSVKVFFPTNRTESHQEYKSFVSKKISNREMRIHYLPRIVLLAK